jgi:inorganic pyrophosphatase
MASSLSDLPVRDPDSGHINVVVDTPKGSRNKYKYDEKSQVWRLSKMLPLGSVFPFDFGFIPSTKGEDGDPVDVLVLTEAASFAGCVLPTLLIGVLEAEQTENDRTVRNDRLIGVVETQHNKPLVRTLDELDESRVREIEHFFISYNEVEGRNFKVLGRHGSERAMELLKAALPK